ncbi:MAG: DUF692 family protein [Planctomycetes bacterium]|nr:DUF692 family protein [Planctomycetota bacterium]
MRPLLGIALAADRAFLQRNRRLIEEQAEIFEITPETLWQSDCAPGANWSTFVQMVQRSGRPAIGHGVLFSLGAAAAPPRRAAWLAALQRDQQAFGFRWFSEHLGFADADGQHTALPLPLPPTEEAIATVAASLRALQTFQPTVAFENNADYISLGDPLAQPGFFAAICERADARLLLDLHNAYTQCLDLGVDLDAWLDRLPWSRVLEIHLSGGSESDPDWLPSRRVFRLDSHDGAVPEPVWRAFERALPRAPALQAVILEWMPDDMQEEHAAVFAADFARARTLLR